MDLKSKQVEKTNQYNISWDKVKSLYAKSSQPTYPSLSSETIDSILESIKMLSKKGRKTENQFS